MFTWEFPPSSVGGTAAHVDGLAHALTTLGHEVVVITPRVPGTPADTIAGGVRIVRAETDLPWLPDGEIAGVASGNHALLAELERLGTWRPDIVHGHDWRVAWAAHGAATLLGVPMITRFHGTERGRHGGHLSPGVPVDINSVEWWQASHSTRVITATRLLVRDIVDGFEIDPDIVRRIPGGIDPAWWRTIGDGESPDARRGGTVLAWGRVQYEKGFQVLARAMSVLRKRMAGVECTIAGRGSYLPELQSQIDLAGVGDLVDLVGFVSDHELRSAIHSAGCVVIPSLYEPFGVVEALAGGAPLIVADTGGLAELVGGTGSALLFEPGNADDLAECIEQVLSDPDLADDLVRSGSELLEATYSWSAIAARTAAVYAEALTG